MGFIVSNQSPILLLIHCIEPSSILQLGLLHYSLTVISDWCWTVLVPKCLDRCQ